MASHLDGINVRQISKDAVYKTDENGKVSVYNQYGTLVASGFADKEGAKGAIKQLEKNYIAERDKQRAYLNSGVRSLVKTGAWKKMTPEERVAARKNILKDVTISYYDNLNDSMRADNGTLSTYFDRFKTSAATTTTQAPAATVNNTAVATKPNTLASSSLPTKNTAVQAPVARPAVQAPVARPAVQAPVARPAVQAPVAQAPAVQTYQPATTQTTQAQPTAAQRVVAAKTQFQSAPSRVVNNAGTQTSQVTSSRRRPNSLVADRYAALRKQ